MAYDIYGNNLRPGHCEVHPHIHEEYPCSTCMAESRQSQQQPEYDKVGELEHYLGQAQQEIERLTAEVKRAFEAGYMDGWNWCLEPDPFGDEPEPDKAWQEYQERVSGSPESKGGNDRE